MGGLQSRHKKYFFVLIILLSVICTSSSYGARSDVEAFVTRFYELCLDRYPDPAGLNGWVSGLLDGSLTGSDVAYGFVFSNEFLDKNTSDDDYLMVLYEAFFNRQPDPGGFQSWKDALNSGSSWKHVLNGFIFAVEFAELCDSYDIRAFEGHVTKAQKDAVEAFVTRFYQLCLDRNPDSAGLQGWMNNLLNQIQAGADVANGFMYSKEFLEKNISNADFLSILYKAFFDRGPDPAGWNTWLAELNSGKDRRLVLDGFVYSQEFIGLCERFGIIAFKSVPTYPFDGIWVGKATSTVPSVDCGDAIVEFVITNFQIQGSVVDAWGETIPVSGSVDAHGTLTAQISIDPYHPVSISGTLSGDSGSGSWSEPGGCRGTWSLTKQTGSINMDSLKGTYALSDFTARFDNGVTYTPDDFGSFSGSMTITSSGKMSQNITVEGYQIVAAADFVIVNESTLLVASEGCVFQSGFSYDGTQLTTTFPSGVCGSDFTETDVWKKTSSSATLLPSRIAKSLGFGDPETMFLGGAVGGIF